MPVNAWMKIDNGETQGLISAGVQDLESVGGQRVEGHDDEILVWAYGSELDVPRDPASGQPTGKRVHKPVEITKTFDKSSPLLHQALSTGEKIGLVTIGFYRISAEGREEQYFTVKLEDALIVKIIGFMPNFQDPTKAHLQQMEKVFFTYRKITWEHVASGTEAEDDWRAPVA